MQVNDIRPDSLSTGMQAAIEADIAFLQRHRHRFVEVDCPACGAAARTALYDKAGMTNVRCDACATQYISPRPDATLLAEFYSTSVNYAYWAKHIFPASAEARRQNIFRPRAQRMAELARRLGLADGTLVEVGAGYGLFCEEIAREGVFSRIVAIEPTPDLAQLCRDKGLEVIESPVEAVTFDFPVDMVASFEVIEHLFDPAAFIRTCFNQLRPGGYAFLTCPNISGFDTLLLGREAVCVDHEHINYFNPASLTLLLERTGFVDVEVSTPGQLDFDLVRRAVAEGAVTAAQLGPFLGAVFADPDPRIGRAFQDFLVTAKLSSHMQVIARRPLA